jgi:DNA-binding LacI/PurR family transcriptional regulator
MPLSKPNGRHLTTEIVAAIVERHITKAGDSTVFLPPERALTIEYRVARTTVRRALALLTSRGLIVPEHGRGYRILPHDQSAPAVFRIAILQAAQTSRRYHGRTSQNLVDALMRQSLKRKWQVLTVDVEDLQPEAVLRTLQDAQIRMVALVIEDQEIFQCLRRAGIACVAIESATRDLPIDYIFQDNFGGARLAARHLLDKGHKRIGWLGPVAQTLTAFERFAGARSALVERQMDFRPEDVVAHEAHTEQPVQALLSRPDRPTAILALWRASALALAKAASRLGLTLGRDLDVVGWSTDESHQVIRAAMARDAAPGAVLPMVLWNTDELAEVVAARMQLHRIEPELRPLHIAIPPRLVVVNGIDDAGDGNTLDA